MSRGWKASLDFSTRHEWAAMDRILVVDDEPQVLEGLRRALGRHFIIDPVTCAYEALRRLAGGERYSAIVSDLAMTAMDGVTLLERARQITPTIPRVMLSGHGDRSALIEAINRAGVVAFLQKPTSPSELLQVLRTAIGSAEVAAAQQAVPLTPKQQWIAAELARADQDGQFRLLLQPRVDASDGRLVAAEALLRWDHPRRGPVSPADFIPVAEATGHIDRITAWVLRETGRVWRGLKEEGVDMSISVNVSAASIGRYDLVEAIGSSLALSGMPMDRLEVEITESRRLEMIEPARVLLCSLKSQGVQTALDDFGTGHASLEMLRQLDVDVLKIDRSFVVDFAHNARHREIVRSIIDLSRALHLDVVAEGVETLTQASLLYAYGVHEFQGYLYAPALSAQQLLPLYRSKSGGFDASKWQPVKPSGGN
jgi:EAL domain-containing protein (putative c-di-GMP-specific phosphodiesterase class I)/CheY-like chemotaxis protein